MLLLPHHPLPIFQKRVHIIFQIEKQGSQMIKNLKKRKREAK